MGKRAIPAAPARGGRTAVVLLSGGLDSATCLALVTRWGWNVHALSFDYGQRHRVELAFARRLARRYRAVSHRVIRIPGLGALGGSALTDPSIAVPKRRNNACRRPDGGLNAAVAAATAVIAGSLQGVARAVAPR